MSKSLATLALTLALGAGCATAKPTLWDRVSGEFSQTHGQLYDQFRIVKPAEGCTIEDVYFRGAPKVIPGGKKIGAYPTTATVQGYGMCPAIGATEIELEAALSQETQERLQREYDEELNAKLAREVEVELGTGATVVLPTLRTAHVGLRLFAYEGFGEASKIGRITPDPFGRYTVTLMDGGLVKYAGQFKVCLPDSDSCAVKPGAIILAGYTPEVAPAAPVPTPKAEEKKAEKKAEKKEAPVAPIAAPSAPEVAPAVPEAPRKEAPVAPAVLLAAPPIPVPAPKVEEKKKVTPEVAPAVPIAEDRNLSDLPLPPLEVIPIDEGSATAPAAPAKATEKKK